MDVNRFTQRSREALVTAQNLAAERHQQEVTSKHLLYALLEQEGGAVPRFFRQMGVNLNDLRRSLEELLKRIPAVHGYQGSLHLSAALARVLARAEKEAQALKDDYVSVEHLLLALLEEGEEDVKSRLRQAGINRDSFLNALRSIRGSQRVVSENPEDTYEALERYGRDLTRLAQEGKLD
ncbi:MAG: Clp protease N-terminal domain-containing protein, partial [Syntrophomonadaceae bacterium]|nr:Clp protease N-terminal domain-containing protein [Syntrophomonadaceae bacterium]